MFNLFVILSVVFTKIYIYICIFLNAVTYFKTCIEVEQLFSVCSGDLLKFSKITRIYCLVKVDLHYFRSVELFLYMIIVETNIIPGIFVSTINKLLQIQIHELRIY